MTTANADAGSDWDMYVDVMEEEQVSAAYDAEVCMTDAEGAESDADSTRETEPSRTESSTSGSSTIGSLPDSLFIAQNELQTRAKMAKDITELTNIQIKLHNIENSIANMSILRSAFGSSQVSSPKLNTLMTVDLDVGELDYKPSLDIESFLNEPIMKIAHTKLVQEKRSLIYSLARLPHQRIRRDGSQLGFDGEEAQRYVKEGSRWTSAICKELTTELLTIKTIKNTRAKASVADARLESLRLAMIGFEASTLKAKIAASTQCSAVEDKLAEVEEHFHNKRFTPPWTSNLIEATIKEVLSQRFQQAIVDAQQVLSEDRAKHDALRLQKLQIEKLLAGPTHVDTEIMPAQSISGYPFGLKEILEYGIDPGGGSDAHLDLQVPPAHHSDNDCSDLEYI